MTKGIEIRDIALGDGQEAQIGKTAVFNLRTFLHRGEEIFLYPEPRVKIDLRGRPCIAGLLKGIIGMHVGGKRILIIGPHLAYGAEGLPGKVPANALLRCEVELLEVRELYSRSPEDLPPDKHVVVYHPGEAKRNLPRWQIRVSEDGTCGAGLYFPVPGMTWRHTRRKVFEATIEPAIAEAVLRDAATLPVRFPDECLSTEELWADASEPANSITRDRETDTLCLTIDSWEKGQHHHYCMRENSPALNSSELYRTIISLLLPDITEDRTEQSKPRSTPRLPH